MLCTLALRRDPVDRRTCILRITGETALGPSAAGGRDEVIFHGEAALMESLRKLGVTTEVLASAEYALSSAESDIRFLTVGEHIQIAFDALEQADIHLFD